MLHRVHPTERLDRCTLPSMTPVQAGSEVHRLSILRHYEILDTPPQAPFERITTLAANLFNVPIAIIGFLDHDRLWFKSHRGLLATEVQRVAGSYISILQVLIGGGVDPGFFASAPLRTQDGLDMGEICVIDMCPHRAEEHLVHNLKALADIVMDQLELRLSARREQAAPASPDVRARFASLTLRQREILERVVAGQPSKNIAADLGISRRTVESHRASIMQKTGATSIPVLAQLALLGAGFGARELLSLASLSSSAILT
jgi:DNA-binding CsgD family transcriptional regulator